MRNLALKFSLLAALCFCSLGAENLQVKKGDEINSQASEIQKGKKIYDYWCLPCHGANMPATNALAVLFKGTDIPAELDKRTDLVPEVVEYFVRNGKHSMPFFRKTEINDSELKSLAAYLGRDRNKNKK